MLKVVLEHVEYSPAVLLLLCRGLPVLQTKLSAAFSLHAERIRSMVSSSLSQEADRQWGANFNARECSSNTMGSMARSARSQLVTHLSLKRSSLHGYASPRSQQVSRHWLNCGLLLAQEACP